MIIDARSVSPGTIIDTELCIIGAGAAGITLARECIGASFRVVLLESGGTNLDPGTQDLYEGRSVGDPFADLMMDRLRFLGGSTNHWGGWCLPFEAIDFEPRGDEFPYHGWPFSKAQLDPWYARAQEACQLGPYDYRPSRWGVPPDKVPPPFAGPDFEVRILQENPLRFGPTYAPEFRRAPRVTVYLYADAVHLDAGETEAEVGTLAVKTLSGNAFTVRARFYVLATGGIENARLLLASGREDGKGLGNAHDLVGRFFMTHLAYSGGTIVPADPHMNFDFETNDPYVPGKYRVDRILGLSADAMRRLHLPNMMLGWMYKFAPVREAIEALKRVTRGEGPGGSTLSDLSEVIANFEGVSDFLVRKALFGQGNPDQGPRALVQLRTAAEPGQPHLAGAGTRSTWHAGSRSGLAGFARGQEQRRYHTWPSRDRNRTRRGSGASAPLGAMPMRGRRISTERIIIWGRRGCTMTRRWAWSRRIAGCTASRTSMLPGVPFFRRAARIIRP